MSNIAKVALAILVSALFGFAEPSSAHAGRYPLTPCGPDLSHLCRLHGYFDTPPFHYHLAVYPGCIRVAPVQTPYGVERRRVLVCGAPARPMVWW
jgi:hypothetical protein